ncbi:hypothetical protein RJT34_15072 [Clitoria ternatea]|uniref:Uncharacterized protein n=1 Tax=Clitoria ternatea TaxID=43366 RepID=A0AAN9JRW7_CLITE
MPGMSRGGNGKEGMPGMSTGGNGSEGTPKGGLFVGGNGTCGCGTNGDNGTCGCGTNGGNGTCGCGTNGGNGNEQSSWFSAYTSSFPFPLPSFSSNEVLFSCRALLGVTKLIITASKQNSIIGFKLILRDQWRGDVEEMSCLDAYI